MDRTAELLQAFEESGLREFLDCRALRYFDDYTPFSKLLFKKNHFRLQTMEIYVPRLKASYFRVTFHVDAPVWLRPSLIKLPGFIGENKAGCNFLNSPSDIAMRLGVLISEQTKR